MRITFRHIAKETGVSSATVSNVLNNRGGKVSATTRQRILEAVERLGYIPVAAPQNQSQPVATKIIGLVFDDLDEVLDYVGAQTYLGLREGARHHGYDLLTILREKPEWAGTREEIRFMDRRSDGIIFINPHQRYDVIEKLQQNNITVVCCYAHNLPPDTPYVALDESHAMQLVIDHLYELRHRQIGFLAGPAEQNANVRSRAFLHACQAKNLHSIDNIFQVTNDQSWAPDREAVRQALTQAKERGLTTLVCANDQLAFCALQLAAELKIAVPRELSLTGFDDGPVAVQHGLTTIHHPFKDIARAAVDMLVQRLQAPDEISKAQLFFEPRLVTRTSTTKAAS